MKIKSFSENKNRASVTRSGFLKTARCYALRKKDYIITYTDIQPQCARKAAYAAFALDFSFVLLYNIIKLKKVRMPEPTAGDLPGAANAALAYEPGKEGV
ncbi:MAG: hypothetical protein ACI3XO_05970 [Eubacteriales bacterium]